MKTFVLAAALMAASFTAWAGNDHSNPCGNNGNNCNPSGDVTANGGDGGNGYGGHGYGGDASATGVGIGVGVGLGGEGGQGGEGGRGGSGGSAVALGGGGGSVNGSGNSANLNANTAKGGSAEQSQAAISGSRSIAQMASENSLKNKVNASSANDNRSSAAGNTTVTNVGGDSTLVERNAPPVFLGALTPTSCGGGFNAGGSSRDGAGAFGIQWVGKECRIRMVGDRYHALGMVDTACEVYKTTKGFRDAAKVNPKLRDLDCTVKPAAVVAPAEPVIPKEFVEARTPRG